MTHASFISSTAHQPEIQRFQKFLQHCFIHVRFAIIRPTIASYITRDSLQHPDLCFHNRRNFPFVHPVPYAILQIYSNFLSLSLSLSLQDQFTNLTCELSGCTKMHLEDYHVNRSEEDVQRAVSKSIKQEGFNSLRLTPITTINTSSQPCWVTSHTDSVSSPVLPNNSSPREFTDWEQLTTVFQYPCQPYTSTDRSPGSTGSEATTPTWNNVIHSETPDCSNGQRLPSVGSAFSFSRNFCNTAYPEYQDYQDYQEYQDDVSVSLPFILHNQAEDQGLDGSMQAAADEFDLSLIRGDPTSLLCNVESPPSPSSTYLQELQDPFSNLNGSCYAVGHLVSGQQSSVSTTPNFVNDNSGLNDGFGNQVVLPRNEGLLLTDRRVPASDTEKRSASFGEPAYLYLCICKKFLQVSRQFHGPLLCTI